MAACLEYPTHMWFGNLEPFNMFDKIDFAYMKEILEEQKDDELVGLDILIDDIGYGHFDDYTYDKKVKIPFKLNGKEFNVVKEFNYYDGFDKALADAREIQDDNNDTDDDDDADKIA